MAALSILSTHLSKLCGIDGTHPSGSSGRNGNRGQAVRVGWLNVVFSLFSVAFLLEFFAGADGITLFLAVYVGFCGNLFAFVTAPSSYPRGQRFYQKRFEKNFDRDIKTVKAKTPGDLHNYLQSRGWEYTGNFSSGDSQIYHWDHKSPNATFSVFGCLSGYSLKVEKSYNKK